MGALYVGWRQRRLTRELAEFQADLADDVLRRQLWMTFAARALLVAKRASEVMRVATGANPSPRAGRTEMARRMERLDSACDHCMEAWAEVTSWDVATSDMVSSVADMTDSLEAARLRILLDASTEGTHALASVERTARKCHELAAAVPGRRDAGRKRPPAGRLPRG